jgi:hypothetical protein
VEKEIEILDSLSVKRKCYQYGGKIKFNKNKLISNLDMLDGFWNAHIAAMLECVTPLGATRLLVFTFNQPKKMHWFR